MQAARVNQFSASYDRTTKIISSLVCAVLLLIAAAIPNIYMAGLSVLVLILAYAYSARGYAVTEDSILVRRPIGSAGVPLAQVREARRANVDDLQGCIRLWGSGGLFGYYGLFHTSRLGRCTWYVTDRKNAVIVKTDTKTTLYSPDDVDGFLGAIRSAAPAGMPAAGEWLKDALGSYRGATPGIFKSGLASAALGIMIALAAGTMVVMSARYSPGPPDYVLTPATLAIHDRFYPFTVRAGDVDAAAVRVVDLAEESAWRPSKRTRGFSNSHYRSGIFRTTSGRTVRLYWANGTRMVLLPPKGESDPILMEVADPAAFVQQVRREWLAAP